MTVKTEGRHMEEFLLSEAKGARSREAATLASGQKVVDGTVMIFSGGKLIISAGHLNSGSALDETFAGIICGNWDASATGENADIVGVPYIARDAEVHANRLTYYSGSTGSVITKIKAKLVTMGIIPRA